MSAILLSQVPDATGRVFPNVHKGGTNSRLIDGMGVEASLGADAIWYLGWLLPPTLPSGTCKLKLWALANATTGSAKINPKWASVNDEENPDTITLNAETTQTLTWASGDNDQIKELLVILDADTPLANEMLYMALTFETTSWTLAQISTWLAALIWE